MKTVHHPTIPDLSYEVHDSAVNEWKAAGWRLTAAPSATESGNVSKYADLTLDELKQEIDERNDDGRASDARLSKPRHKPDLINILVADDEAKAAAAAE